MRVANMANTFYLDDEENEAMVKTWTDHSDPSAAGEHGAMGLEMTPRSSSVDRELDVVPRSRGASYDAVTTPQIPTRLVAASVTVIQSPDDQRKSVILQKLEDESLRRSIRRYLHKEQEIRLHPLWRKDGFWDMAMLIGISNQLDLQAPIRWDDIESDEEIKDIVIGTR